MLPTGSSWCKPDGASLPAATVTDQVLTCTGVHTPDNNVGFDSNTKAGRDEQVHKSALKYSHCGRAMPI